MHNGTIGFGITGVNLNLASVKTATNSYTGLELTFASASIAGFGDTLQLDVTNGFVRVNKVQTGTTKLDWAAFTGGPLFGLNLNATTDLSVGGTLDVQLGGFVYAHGSFAITKETLLVTPVGCTTAVSVDALEIGVDGGTLFAGVGYGTAAAMGVSFSGISIGLVSRDRRRAATSTSRSARAAPPRSSASTGFDIGGTLEVQMNTGKNGAVDVAAIDFTKLPAGKLSIPTGGTPVDLNLGADRPAPRHRHRAPDDLELRLHHAPASRSRRASRRTSSSTTATSATSTSSRSESATVTRSSARTARTG